MELPGSKAVYPSTLRHEYFLLHHIHKNAAVEEFHAWDFAWRVLAKEHHFCSATFRKVQHPSPLTEP